MSMVGGGAVFFTVKAAAWSLAEGHTVTLALSGKRGEVWRSLFYERGRIMMGASIVVATGVSGYEQRRHDGDCILIGASEQHEDVHIRLLLDTPDDEPNPFHGCLHCEGGLVAHELQDDHKTVDQAQRDRVERTHRRRSPLNLSNVAHLMSTNTDFHRWLIARGYIGNIGQPEAKQEIRRLCRVSSCGDFDRDPAAAKRFHRLIRHPFQRWMGNA